MKTSQKKQKCATKRCAKKTAKGAKHCSACRMRKYREQNPVKAAYDHLKYNAARRGHEFMLTIEQFKAFCVETNYIMGKGRTKESYSIDRIDNDKGYTIDNIRVLTVSENSKKYTKSLSYEYRQPDATRFYAIPGPECKGEQPF